MEPLLTVDGLSVSFAVDGATWRVVDDVSFAVQRGEVLGLVGESGCGKSVTAMSLLRLIPQPPGRLEAGRVLFGGRDLLRLPLPELRHVRGREIGVIFQEPMTALSPLQRIGKQLVEALRLHDASLSYAAAWSRGVEWLRRVGIPEPAERMYAYPFQFSGGMRQRAMIATVLTLEPQLVIADEPTTALDVTIQAQIFALLRQMRRDDLSVLLITHDLGVVWELCDRVLVMYAAQLVEEAPTAALFADPRHPYTQGLLRALPPLRGSAERLATIEGQVPSPPEYPAGCRFAERCPHCCARCRREAPALSALPDGRRVRCFKAQAAAAGGAP